MTSSIQMEQLVRNGLASSAASRFEEAVSHRLKGMLSSARRAKRALSPAGPGCVNSEKPTAVLAEMHRTATTYVVRFDCNQGLLQVMWLVGSLVMTSVGAD